MRTKRGSPNSKFQPFVGNDTQRFENNVVFTLYSHNGRFVGDKIVLLWSYAPVVHAVFWATPALVSRENNSLLLIGWNHFCLPDLLENLTKSATYRSHKSALTVMAFSVRLFTLTGMSADVFLCWPSKKFCRTNMSARFCRGQIVPL